MTIRNNESAIKHKKKEGVFLGNVFHIDKQTHTPHKSTEPLVGWVSEYISKDIKKDCVVADIGTGSGVIAISLALVNPFVKKVFATDLYQGAIRVTEKNITRFNLKGKVIPRRGDLLAPVQNEKINIIVSNPPAVRKRNKTHKEEGVRILKRFFRQISQDKYLPKLSAVFIKTSPNEERSSRIIKCIKNWLSPSANIKIHTKKDGGGNLRYLRINFL